MIHEPHTQALPGFFGPSQALFGWYHPPKPTSPPQIPVLLCNPIGFELVRVHKTVRALAIALASRGHPVLRFDYRSTGDSLDASWDQGKVDGWLNDIRDAIEHLRALTGCQDFSILGIRMGATFASLLAEECRPASAVLWEPIAAGKLFSREMQILQSGHKFATQDRDEPGIIAGGFYFSPPTVEQFDQIDLTSESVDPSIPVLVVERDDLPSNKLRNTAITGRHENAEFVRLPGYKAMMLAPQRSTLPDSAIQEIVDWIASKHDQRARPASTAAAKAAISNIHSATTTGSECGCRETVLRFGRNDSLFGILTQPKLTESHATPAVILLCGGAVPRYSANRMYTQLARQLAATGHTVLRMDLSGIGDSDSLPNEVRDKPYFSTAGSDVATAIDAVIAQSGSSRCTLIGLCSGAFAALDAAKESSLVTHAVLINQLVYYVGAAQYEDLLTGRITPGQNLDFPRIAGRFRKSVIKSLLSMGALGQRVGYFLQRYLIGGRLTKDLEKLARKGTHLSFIHSENNQAQNALFLSAGPKLRKLSELGVADYQVVPDTDHIFSSLRSQKVLFERIQSCLQDVSRPRRN